MSSSTVDAYIRALEDLSSMPDDDAPQMTEALIDRYVQLVCAIDEALNGQFDVRAMRALVRSFGAGDGFETYWTTVHAIERIHDTEATYRLVHEAISTSVPGVRKWCCLLLGRRHNPQDLPYLIARLSDPEERVIVEALSAIRMIAQRYPISPAIPDIETLVSDSRPTVAAAARRVLPD